MPERGILPSRLRRTMHHPAGIALSRVDTGRDDDDLPRPDVGHRPRSRHRQHVDGIAPDTTADGVLPTVDLGLETGETSIQSCLNVRLFSFS